MNEFGAPLWRRRAFHWYLGSTGGSGLAFAMQQLLASWILIGILALPASQVGVVQAAIGIPGIFLILMGGARADGADARALLIWVYFLAPVFPLLLAASNFLVGLSVWNVLLWGLGVGFVQSYSMPGQQALLNRIGAGHVQKSVAAATAVGYVVQVAGLLGAGFIDQVGLIIMLAAQAGAFLVAAMAMLRLPAQPQPEAPQIAALARIREGLQATRRQRIVFDVLMINFVSSIFNAGSFQTVFPFIVTRVYAGDALTLSSLMALFFTGAALSNLLLMRLMPLARPGRLFLLVQLSRIVVLLMLYAHGGWWLLILAVFLWGLNMGVTSNLARTIVQESAAEQYRGRILSVFSVSMVGSVPIGAILLGALIDVVGTLNALVPAMVLSLLLFAYGIRRTGIWQYRSAE